MTDDYGTTPPRSMPSPRPNETIFEYHVRCQSATVARIEHKLDNFLVANQVKELEQAGEFAVAKDHCRSHGVEIAALKHRQGVLESAERAGEREANRDIIARILSVLGVLAGAVAAVVAYFVGNKP